MEGVVTETSANPGRTGVDESVEATAAGGTGVGESGAIVSVRNLVKTFRRADGTLVNAVTDVSVDVNPGEFVVLLGPSGCGKTTLLRCVAGLERPDSGMIRIHGREAFDSSKRLNRPPQVRRVSMIFQSYALWPHMTAFDNVAYPLRSRKVKKAEVAGRVQRALEMVGIPELTGQHPGQMSGGQQQRVALARALVGGDGLILFDEPLSNVDAKVREQLRIELVSMQREIGFSALYVTHDQIEAMELAHRIAVMREGKIAQLGPPRDVYERPRSRYVANFIGTTNEITGKVIDRSERTLEVDTELGVVVATPAREDLDVGDEAVVVCRPERCAISTEKPDASNAWQGVVAASLFSGSHTEHVVTVGDKRFRIWHPDPEMMDDGVSVWVSVDAQDLLAVRA